MNIAPKKMKNETGKIHSKKYITKIESLQYKKTIYEKNIYKGNTSSTFMNVTGSKASRIGALRAGNHPAHSILLKDWQFLWI